jgi:succinyl-diaminopimelate desuccinylase
MRYLELQERIRAFCKEHHGEMMADLAQLVAVPSVVAVPLPDKPYGEAPREVLHRAEAIAKRMGFVVSETDNACMTAMYGDRPVQLCLMAHLDVVDAGSGWTKEPYALTEEPDRIYGRGVADDKGPAIAVLYAMKAARELCPDLPYSPQAWFGTAEEVGSPDLRNYMKHTKLPKYTLTPDAIEPIVIGESAKHRPSFGLTWEKSESLPRVVKLEGGKIRNAIPGYAEAVVAGLTMEDVERTARECAQELGVVYELFETETGVKICANGRGAHIGTPHLGRNGQTALVEFLCRLPLAEYSGTQALHALRALFPHGMINGEGLGLTLEDEIMGKPHANFTVCTMTETEIACKMDSRGPTNAVPENYAYVIDKALKDAGFTVEPSEMEDAHYVKETEPQVQLVKELYEAVFGRPAECYFSIGASYAHYVDGAISTGVAAPGIDTMLHKADEFLPLEDFNRMVELYTLAILNICSQEHI